MTTLTIRELGKNEDGGFRAALIFEHAEELAVAIQDPFGPSSIATGYRSGWSPSWQASWSEPSSCASLPWQPIRSTRPGLAVYTCQKHSGSAALAVS